MPRRVVASATPNRASPNVSFRDDSILPLQDASYHDNIATLRRHWKWAAFSQFFYTFHQLLAMPDVNLSDVEDDLAHGSALYIPRVMHRLLYTLTQDRKINVDNWQTGLRKQYLRRDPDANPLGVEPPAPSRKESREPSSVSEIPVDHEPSTKAESMPQTPLPNTTENAEASPLPAEGTATPQKKVEEEDNALVDDAVKMDNGVDAQSLPPQDEPKDWFELPLLAKLESLHLLTEWQFQNPHRLRTLMKDDGDAAQWRHEPIGYDAKTNAYWLIGPDRLWIQRVPPKPPRQNRKRKAPPKKTPAKASTSKSVPPMESDSEAENEPSPSKRRRTSERAPARRGTSGRATRSKAKESATTSSGRGTRAAKLQANKKLDAQAKELAEYQRQAALLTSPSRSSGGRTTRQTRSSNPNGSTQAPPTPARRSMGTRTSARLRGTTGDASDDDDEWQQIPDEWLNETGNASAGRSRAAKGKGRETRASTRSRAKAKPAAVEESDEDADGDADEDEELRHLAEQAGLESDGESSVLTELSDEPEDAVGEVEPAQEVPVPQESAPPRKDKSKKAKQPPAEPEPEPEPEQKPSEDVQSHIPSDFIEWEAICVTLYQWEHVADQFEKSNNYLEKALYKVLSKNIVPLVTEDLKERDRKRKLEEAIVHRKRSSRIATRETEKEEARAAAQKKAEEDAQMARVRRAEARAKKEEADREKREKAREQRRLEREERERLKQEQEEREKEAVEIDIVSGEAAKARATNGAGSSRHSVSRHTSRVVASSGARTPDWTLDCEICHRSGVNLDDGQAMVCCNSCQKWQHIACHDTADRNLGRPPRDWNRQQFYCQRCRPPPHPRVLNGGTPPHALPQRHVEQYGWPQAQGQKAMPPPQHAYPQPTSDARYSQYANYESNTSYQPYVHNRAVPQGSYARPQGNITFSHYQPEQGGFSRTSQQGSMGGATSWPAGYPSHGMPSQSQQPTQLPQQYSQNGQNGVYNGGRVAQAYQYQTSPQQSYHNSVPDAMPAGTNGSWANVSNDYYTSAGSAGQLSANQLNAAESLAYMQRSGRHGWQNGSPQVPQNNGYPPSAQLPSMAPHHYPPA